MWCENVMIMMLKTCTFMDGDTNNNNKPAPTFQAILYQNSDTGCFKDKIILMHESEWFIYWESYHFILEDSEIKKRHLLYDKVTIDH